MKIEGICVYTAKVDLANRAVVMPPTHKLHSLGSFIVHKFCATVSLLVFCLSLSPLTRPYYGTRLAVYFVLHFVDHFVVLRSIRLRGPTFRMEDKPSEPRTKTTRSITSLTVSSITKTTFFVYFVHLFTIHTHKKLHPSLRGSLLAIQ